MSRSKRTLDKRRRRHCALPAGTVVNIMPADLRDAACSWSRCVDVVERDFWRGGRAGQWRWAAKRTPAAELTAAAWHDAMQAKYFTYIHVPTRSSSAWATRQHSAVVNVIGSGGKVAAVTYLAGGAANAALMLASAGPPRRQRCARERDEPRRTFTRTPRRHAG